ncbi:MAG TPA: hypothetical protein VEJ20_03625 [Candidatus Eremiobacteraceae bacterium]|nr:hypothetical protein [Candidatus Eremiobacteraceae bacterium]
MLGGVLVTGTVAAAAASTTGSGSQFGIQIGALFPNTGDARFLGGQTQLSAGLNYNFASGSGSTPTASDLYFDFLNGSNNGGYLHSGGLGVQLRTIGRGFLGAGLGLYNTAVRDPDGMSGNVTGAGGKVFAGLGLGGGSSVELDYHIMPSTMGVNPSGLGVEFGFHL